MLNNDAAQLDLVCGYSQIVFQNYRSAGVSVMKRQTDELDSPGY